MLDLVQTTIRPPFPRPAFESLRHISCVKGCLSNQREVNLLIFRDAEERGRIFRKNKTIVRLITPSNITR